MMLNGQVNSALHGVRVPEGERLSIGMFIDPVGQEPVINLVTGKVLHEKYSDYLKLRFNQAYVEPKNVEAAEQAQIAASEKTRDSIHGRSALAAFGVLTQQQQGQGYGATATSASIAESAFTA